MEKRVIECQNSLALFYFAQFFTTIATASMPLSALFIAPFVSSITKKFGTKKLDHSH